MASENLPKLLSITVSAGTGTTSSVLGGEVIAFGIKTPTAGAAFDIEFVDADSFGIGGKPGIVGNSTVYQNFQAHGTITICLTNASADGTYQVKIWFRGR